MVRNEIKLVSAFNCVFTYIMFNLHKNDAIKGKKTKELMCDIIFNPHIALSKSLTIRARQHPPTHTHID